MAFELPALPYERDALAPHISENTVNVHYAKHHQGYVTKLNAGTENTGFANMMLEDVIRKTAGRSDDAGVFNNAAQIWNHTFYWNSMKPGGGGAPTGDIAGKVSADFGSMDAFKDAFAQAAATQFGSGWAWLCLNEDRLEIRKTANAQTPLSEVGVTPLITLDVWEHAYYLDYQNRRTDYIAGFLDHLLNWDFANANLEAASRAALA